MNRERAVSDVVAYVLIVGVIVTSIALTYTMGLSAITTTQHNEHAQNARRSIVTLANTLDDVQRGGSPARSGEISLSGGTLSVVTTGAFEVGVNNSTGGPWNVTPDGVQYATNGHAVSYVGGGVLSATGGRTYALRAPPVTCTGRAAVVSLVAVRADGSASVSEAGSVLVVSRQTSRDLLYSTGAGSNPQPHTVTVTPPDDADAWSRVFEANGWTRSGGSFTCSNVHTVVVRKTTVRISFVT